MPFRHAGFSRKELEKSSGGSGEEVGQVLRSGIPFVAFAINHINYLSRSVAQGMIASSPFVYLSIC